MHGHCSVCSMQASGHFMCQYTVGASIQTNWCLAAVGPSRGTCGASQASLFSRHMFLCAACACKHASSGLPAGHVGQLMGPKGPFTFLKWAEEYGDIYKVQFMDSIAVVLTNPDTIARIARKTGVARVEADMLMQMCMSPTTASGAGLLAGACNVLGRQSMLPACKSCRSSCSGPGCRSWLAKSPTTG